MLFVNNIKKLVSLGIASCYLKKENNYLNLMLVAKPESGKTSILTGFKLPKNGIHVLSDATKSKLMELIKKEKSRLKYLIIPDFLSISSHSKSVAGATISLLNSGLEEGIREITDYYGGSINQTTYFTKPIVFGIATSTTSQFLSDRRHTKKWHDTGFFSRFLPITYDYTKKQVEIIKNSLFKGEELDNTLTKLNPKNKPILCDGRYVKQLDPFISKLAEANMLYGFRYTRQFRIMLKANALLEGRTEVKQADVDAVERLLHYVNLDYNQL